MFGFYRFVLALAVALSHHGLKVYGFNPGQWAVVCFYVLSGYLMECQYQKLAPLGGVKAFYLDRFLRIFPVYIAVVLVAAWLTPVSWTELALNIALVPLNFTDFLGTRLLIGPAWSLACEVQFYLLVPLLVTAPTRVLRFLTAGSLVVFAFSLYLPYHTFWTYGSLPGMLFTFLSGILIHRRDWSALRLECLTIFGLWLIFLGTKIGSTGLPTGININICTGFLAAVPATVYLSQFSPRHAWDQFLGLFSYPLFLVHMLVLDLCTTYLHITGMAAFLVFSLAASGVLLLTVEKPFDVARYRMRKRKPLSSPAKQPA